jgi:hypothetical protein
MDSVAIDQERFRDFVDALKRLKVPPELEASTHSFKWTGTPDELANAYFAIVAVCHQTSPVGERPLAGAVSGEEKRGWDYLKEKYLIAAAADRKWADVEYWMTLPPLELSELYRDPTQGLTLNRVNERALLLNDAGNRLREAGVRQISTAFDQHGRRLGGSTGFAQFLSSIEAYRDPVRKKTMFFMSLAVKECGWKLIDPTEMVSPVDYHELRGHLRIGTVVILDAKLREKVQRGLVLTEKEDTLVRQKVQEANDTAAQAAGITSSEIHYLCWNVFRNCCMRDADKTHCSTCGTTCKLPKQYKTMPGYEGRCVFSNACASANKPEKVIDPPYGGHYY